MTENNPTFPEMDIDIEKITFELVKLFSIKK